MNRKHFTTNQMLRKALIIALTAVLAVGSYHLSVKANDARAEAVTTQAWILVSDYVNIRLWPNKRATEVGHLDPCDEIEIDGRTKDGFAHIVSPVDGWVHAGYIVFSKPEKINETYSVVARRRVAARRWIDGPQCGTKPWLINGSEVKVLYMNGEWAVTSRGYVKSEWLEAAP